MAERNLEFRIFKPPHIACSLLDIGKLNSLTGKRWHYASSGKACLFHILKALHIKGKILLPAYACDSLLVPVRKLKLEPVFYDADLRDLNPDFDSVSRLALQFDIKAVIVVSLYGHPAALEKIEAFCSERGIKMIDDAAQSFGSSLNGRLTGTFGQAGFFSFSPGKATAGHMGGFFWTENEYRYKSRRHSLIHYIKWLDFYFNRYRVYDYRILNPLKNLLSLFSGFCLRRTDLLYDSIAPFEKKILGGILSGNLEGKYEYRNLYVQEFSKKVVSHHFRVIVSVRGRPNSHKLVLLFKQRAVKQAWKEFFNENRIYCSDGYALLENDLSVLPNLREIEGNVLELPIEDDAEKMYYLIEKIDCFLSKWK